MTEFDPSKPVMTRDGRKARIICTDRTCLDAFLGSFPIVALVDDGECGTESLYAFNTEGAWVGRNFQCDLVNIPESKWMNFYSVSNALAAWWDSKEAADYEASIHQSYRVGVIEWTASGDFIVTAVGK